VERFGPVAVGSGSSAFLIEIDDGRIATLRAVADRPTQLALPAFADLHVHADRAFEPGRRRARSLTDAIELAREVKLASSEDAIRNRATLVFERALSHGTQRLRTHVDVDRYIGERALSAVFAARERLSESLDVEVVAFATAFADPTTADGEARLRAAAEAGADLLGGAPTFHSDPAASIERLLELAAELGLPADLHVDEATSPDAFHLEVVADATLALGLEGRVTASHACGLAAVDSQTATRTIAKLAGAGITVVSLPALNLFLQGRDQPTPRVRGITLVNELLSAAVPVRFASDNIRDAFYPYGDGDPLETAWLTALSAHVDESDALLAGVCDGQTRLAVGDPADFVLVDATSLVDALARRPGGRTVVHGGKVVSSQTLREG
jgi:cytosine deaminase